MAKKKTLNKRLVVLLVAGVVILCGVAGTAFYLTRPNNPVRMVEQAQALQKERRYLDASKSYVSAIDAWRSKGDVPSLVKALTDLAQLKVEWMGDANMTAADRIQRYREARSHLTDALQQDGKYVPALKAMAELEQMAAQGSGDWTAFIEAQDRLLAVTPTDGEETLRRAKAKAQMSMSRPEYVAPAIEDLKKAVELSPANENAWTTLASYYNLQKQQLNAEKTLKLALEKNPNSVDLRIVYARLLWDTDRKAEVMGKLMDAVQVQPTALNAYAAVAEHLYVHERNIDEAIKWLQKGADTVPTDYRGYMNLARFLGMAGKLDEAEATLEKGLGVVRAANEKRTETRPTASDRERVEFATAVGNLDTLLADVLMDQLQTNKLSKPREQVMTRAEAVVKDLAGFNDRNPRTRRLQGRLALLQGNVAQAEAILSEAWAASRFTDADSGRLLVSVYQKLNQLGEVQKIIEQLMNAGQTSPLLKADLISLYVEYRQYDKARRAVNDLLLTLPNDDNLKATKAGLDAVLGQSNRIPADLKTLTEPSLRLFLQQAGSLWMEGRRNDAVTLAEDIVDRNGAFVPGVFTLIDWYRARGEQDKAKALVAKAQKTFESNADILNRLNLMTETDPEKILAQQILMARQDDPVLQALAEARIYAGAGKAKEKEALDAYARAEKAGPKHPAVVAEMFEQAVSGGNWAKAGEYARIAAEGNLDDAGGVMYKVRIAMAQQKWAEAVDLLQTLVSQRPKSSQAHTLLGTCWMNMQPPQIDKALVEYQTAYTQSPNNVQALLGLIQLYGMTGRQTDYKEHVELAYRFMPGHPEVRERYIQLHEDITKPDAFIRQREEIRKTAPSNLLNLRRLAMLYEAAKNSPAAEQVLRDIAAQTKGVEDYRMLAVFLGQHGRDPEARKLLAEMVELAQDKVTANLFFADYLDSVSKDPAAAKEKYQKAIELDKDGLAYGYMAQVAARNRKFTEAAEHQAKFLEKIGGKPGAKPAEQYMIRLLAAAGKYADAKARIDKMIAANAADADLVNSLRNTRADIYFGEGESLKAKDELDGVLAKTPGNIEALRRRADYYVDQRNYKLAAADLEQARKIQAVPDVVFRLAQVYDLMEDFASGYDVLRALVAEKPDYKPALDQVIALCMKNKRWDTLKQVLTEGKKRFPQDAALLQAEADLYLNLNEPASAVRAIDEAALLAPNDKGIQLGRVRTRIAAGKYDEALTLGEALRGDADAAPLALSAMGTAQVKKNKTEAADALFAEAIKIAKPEQLQYVVTQARTAYGADKATANLKTWAAQRPKDPMMLQLLGESYYSAKDFTGAIDCFKQALPLAENDHHKATLWRLIGQCYQAIGNKDNNEECLKAYTESVRLEPDPGTLNNLGWLLLDLNRPDDAMPYVKQAADMLPNSPEVQDSYGRALLDKKNFAEAERVLTRSMNLQSQTSNRYHLALLYEKMNRPDDAKKHAQAAWELVKNDSKNPYYKPISDVKTRLGL